MSNPTKVVFTVKEACDYLKISRMTCWRLMSTGKLPVSRPSPRCVRIKLADLEKLMVSK